MQEIWQDIENYEGYYQISNLGKVKSLGKFTKTKGNKNQWREERLLSIYTYHTGHKYVVLCKDAVPKKMKLHRLLAFAFIGNPNKLPYINHINGNPSDNRIENLEWCTLSHNTKHAYLTGLAKGKSGSENPASALTENAVQFILQTKGKYTAEELGKMFGVGRWAIQSVFRGDTWSHITGFEKRERDDKRNLIAKEKVYNRITRKAS